MQRKSVFILQDTKESVDILTEKFSALADFQVVGGECDGISAITMIENKKPDVLIVDLVLGGYDGISVIEKVNELNLHTKIFVLSAFSREEAVQHAVSNGADYFMAKPYDFDILVQRIDKLLLGKKEANFAPIRKTSLEEKISKIFINVGIPPHIKGYSFLREGVKMAVEDPAIINNITKKLYPSIGEKYNTSASKVERAIRHAIEVAWNRGRIDSINSILGVRAYIGAEKPTNGEFIALVADKMLLEQA